MKIKRSYPIYKGKVTTSGKNTMLSFSESSKNPKTGEWETSGWWSVCISGAYPCEKEDKVKFTPTAITAITQREYNGKTYYTVFADGKIEYKGNTYNCGDEVREAKEDKGTVIGMTEEQLPF